MNTSIRCNSNFWPLQKSNWSCNLSEKCWITSFHAIIDTCPYRTRVKICFLPYFCIKFYWIKFIFYSCSVEFLPVVTVTAQHCLSFLLLVLVLLVTIFYFKFLVTFTVKKTRAEFPVHGVRYWSYLISHNSGKIFFSHTFWLKYMKNIQVA